MPLTWAQAVDVLRGYLVRISTPGGVGTGFLISSAKSNNMSVVATAAHVVGDALAWEQPVRIDHVVSGKTTLVRHAERAIFLDKDNDTAAIMFDRGDIPFPKEMLPLAPKDVFLRVGRDIGWLGFPGIGTAPLCFFGGRVSAWLEEEEAYLIDGVTINGVSGGPAFHLTDDGVAIMGVVSAYIPNRATGEVLPGMGVVQSVDTLHAWEPTFEKMDEKRGVE